MTTMSLKIGSLNCDCKLTKNEFVFDLTHFASTHSYDLIFLQETGLITLEHEYSAELLHNYQLIPHASSSNTSSHTTGILLTSNISSKIVNSKNLFEGRLQHLHFLWEKNFHIHCLNVYFPTMLEYAAQDTQVFKMAQEMAEYILHLRTSNPSHNMVVGGDFNECIEGSERSSNRLGPFGCRILRFLVGENGMKDASENISIPTFSGIVFGNRIHSKLDRFLYHLPTQIKTIQTQVQVQNSFGTAHCFISIKILVPLPRKTKRPPKGNFIHPDLLNSCSRRKMWVRVNTLMNNLLQNLNIHSCAKSNYIDWIHSKFVAIIQESFKFFQVKTKTKKNRNKHIICSLVRHRRNLRHLKNLVSIFLRNKQELDFSILKLQEVGNHFLPNQSWDRSQLSEVNRSLRTEIKIVTKQINAHLAFQKLNYDDNLDTLFQKNRASFYNRFLRGNTQKNSRISKIYDPDLDIITMDPLKVKRVLVKEASKIFQQPHPEPLEEDKWFYNLYNPQNFPYTSTVWDPLLKKISASDILSTIQSPKGKSPGQDGITKEILFFLCSPLQLSNTKSLPSQTLRIFTILLNLIYTSGHCPPNLMEGLIILISKPGKRNSSEYAHKRPLTLLSEVFKSLQKILSKRLQMILYKNPKILESTQFAFLREGGIDSPLRYLIDIIQKSHINKENFFLISYDQKKAFDSIQHWHIKKALLGLCIPDQFINYIMCIVTRGTSRVGSQYGVTKSISLLRSIRQGDPLSPLLYIICVDTLHKYIRQNVKRGIFWQSNKKSFWDALLGFADDTLLFAPTPSAIFFLHSLVRNFFSRHFLQLNIEKTNSRYLCKNNETLKELLDLDWGAHENALNWLPENVDFRYLGTYIRLDLDPSSHLKLIECSRLYPFLRRVSNSRLTLEHATRAITEVFYPILDFAIRFYATPLTFIKKWDSLLNRALVRKANLCSSKTSYDGMLTCLGFLRYFYHYPKGMIAEHTIFVNMFRTRCNLFTRNRLFNYETLKMRDPLLWYRRSNTEIFSDLHFLYTHFRLELYKNINCQDNLEYIEVESDERKPLYPSSIPHFGPTYTSKNYHIILQSSTKENLLIWTDGSAKDDKIGWSVIVYAPHLNMCGIKRGCFSSEALVGLDEPFGAEISAIGTALSDFPQNNLTVYTDSQKFIHLLYGWPGLSEREKIRQSCRGLLRTTIRAFSQCNKVSFRYVSDTGEVSSPQVKGLMYADKHARFARAHELNESFVYTYHEYPLTILYDSTSLIAGDYRKSLTPILQNLQLCQWKKCSNQGTFPRQSSSILADLRQYRKIIGPSQVYQPWFLDSCLNNLPTFENIFRKTNEYCFLCGYKTLDDNFHYLICPSVQYIIQEIVQKLKHLKICQINSTPHAPSYSGLISKLSRCSEYLKKHIPSIPVHIIQNFVCIYWQNLIQRREVFDFIFFKFRTEDMYTEEASLPEGSTMLNRLAYNDLLKNISYSVVVVPTLLSLPLNFRFWSRYISTYNLNPFLNECRWYELHTCHRLIFMFLYTECTNDFLSQERELSTRASKGISSWIFTKFSPLSINYTPPTDVKVSFTFIRSQMIWRWNFSPLEWSFPTSHPAMNWTNYDFFSESNSKDPMWSFPYFGKYRALLSLPHSSIVTEYKEFWDASLKLHELGILLGFVSPIHINNIQNLLKVSAKNFSNFRSMFWRLVKQIYLLRRRRYNDLTPMIQSQTRIT